MENESEPDIRDMERGGEDKGSLRNIKKNPGREMKQFSVRATPDRPISPLMVIIC